MVHAHITDVISNSEIQRKYNFDLFISKYSSYIFPV